MNPRTKQANHSAVTLLELLVVVSIMAGLVVLLFPMVGKMRERALTAKCAGNIRMYGTAILTMVADKGGLPYWDGLSSALTETGMPQYTKKLADGGYWQTGPKFGCPLAEGSRYDALKIPNRYRFPYAANMALNHYYPKLKVPAPFHRVVLAAEASDSDGFNNLLHLNNAMWRYGTPGAEGAIQPARMPIARYHGSPAKRGLHFFCLDGSVQLVFPTDNDWAKEPVRAPLTGVAETGYFYHTTHFANLKNGKLIAP